MIDEKTTIRAARILCACMAAGWLQFADTQPVHADIYKCVGANGDTTYDDTPCEADKSIHVLTRNARELSLLDCRVARNFSVDIVARMRQGDTVNEVFDVYGGANSLSSDALGLINNVYSFRNSTDTGIQRIVESTVERCQAGVLGENLDQCDAYPDEFIERFGGCTQARQVEKTVLIQPSQGAALPTNVTPPPATVDGRHLDQ